MPVDHVTATAAIDAYLDALGRSDVDAILALYADDATVEDPVGSEVVRGTEALRAFYARAVAGELVATRTGAVRLADREAAFPFTVTARRSGMHLEIIDVMTFDDDGRIVAMRAFWGRANVSRGSTNA